MRNQICGAEKKEEFLWPYILPASVIIDAARSIIKIKMFLQLMSGI